MSEYQISPAELRLSHYSKGGEQGVAPVAVPRESDLFEVEPDEANPFLAAFDDAAWQRLGADVRESITATPASRPARPILAVVVDDLDDTEDDLVDWLAEQTWSTFATSLARQARSGKPLSERQLESARSMRLKCETRAAARAERQLVNEIAAERAFEVGAAIGEVEANRIYKTASGRVYRVQLAKESGRPYAKVLGSNGRFEYEAGAIQALRADATREVISIADAISYGQRFGNCICCGRTLTAGKSVEAGIGPVCSARWGL